MTTVTLRTTTQTGATNKGEALTHAELDANFLFDQSGSGATTRTLQDKAREIVSVKDFGAVGDGVTDDLAAFNLAKAALTEAPPIEALDDRLMPVPSVPCASMM